MCACGPCVDRCSGKDKYDFDIDRTHTRRLESRNLISPKSEDKPEDRGGEGGIRNPTASPTETSRMKSSSKDREPSVSRSSRLIYEYDPVRDELVETLEDLEEGVSPSRSNVCES